MWNIKFLSTEIRRNCNKFHYTEEQIYSTGALATLSHSFLFSSFLCLYYSAEITFIIYNQHHLSFKNMHFWDSIPPVILLIQSISLQKESCCISHMVKQELVQALSRRAVCVVCVCVLCVCVYEQGALRAPQLQIALTSV